MCNPHIVLTLRPSVLPFQGYFALSLFPVVHLGRYSMCGLKLYTCLKTERLLLSGKDSLGNTVAVQLVLTDIDVEMSRVKYRPFVQETQTE